jgi:hypothetical protein
VQLGPCLDGSVTWFQATGENVTAPRTTSVALVAAALGGRAIVSLLSWLELFAHAAARAGSQPSVFFEGSAPVVRGSPISAELAAGISARF